jgi:hypothetical protein
VRERGMLNRSPVLLSSPLSAGLGSHTAASAHSVLIPKTMYAGYAYRCASSVLRELERERHGVVATAASADVFAGAAATAGPSDASSHDSSSSSRCLLPHAFVAQIQRRMCDYLLGRGPDVGSPMATGPTSPEAATDSLFRAGSGAMMFGSRLEGSSTIEPDRGGSCPPVRCPVQAHCPFSTSTLHVLGHPLHVIVVLRRAHRLQCHVAGTVSSSASSVDEMVRPSVSIGRDSPNPSLPPTMSLRRSAHSRMPSDLDGIAANNYVEVTPLDFVPGSYRVV